MILVSTSFDVFGPVLHAIVWHDLYVQLLWDNIELSVILLIVDSANGTIHTI